MKTEKLFHPATGLHQDIQVAYVPAHLANGWVRQEQTPDKPEVVEDEKKEKPPVKKAKKKNG